MNRNVCFNDYLRMEMQRYNSIKKVTFARLFLKYDHPTRNRKKKNIWYY